MIEGAPRHLRAFDGGTEGPPLRAPRHAFLVRLATPNDARMAVRDKQGNPFHYGRLSVTQYPRQ